MVSTNDHTPSTAVDTSKPDVGAIGDHVTERNSSAEADVSHGAEASVQDHDRARLEGNGPEKTSVPESGEGNNELSSASTGDEAPQDSEESIALGTDLSTVHLYRDNRREPWVEEAPDQSSDEDEKDEKNYMKYALVVRREKKSDGPGLALHSINVQSPHIRKFLTEVFEGYRNVHTGLKRLILRPPFYEFFYRWDRLQELLKGIQEPIIREHVDLLLDVIKPKVQTYLDTRKDLLDNGLITFDYLWTLFPPNTETWSKREGVDRIYNVIDCDYRMSRHGMEFVLKCEYIDHNGVMLGHAIEELEMPSFSGHNVIKTGDPLPLALIDNPTSMKTRLANRGKAFMDLTGVHQKVYSGAYFSPENGRREHVDAGRIMVDAPLFYEEYSYLKPRLRPLDLDEPVVDEKSDSASSTGRSSYSDTESGRKTLHEGEYHLCAPHVQGYCLTSKAWGRFQVSQVSAIEFNEAAFAKLVLPGDTKELILSLAESQLASEDGFDDIITGKGQGIIMLLSGEPGVGKTLTAESISEQMHRPLYSMSAGELGYSAYEVERELKKVLDISTKWNAILLLDECDVFLEQRTTADIERNKLVSVLLRLLEYYKGVMFLTTNRISAFDAAFQSRIHLTINYPALDLSSRRTVWETFTTHTVDGTVLDSEIQPSQLDVLAKEKFNGREIKNIVKTARLLARRKKVALSMSHVQTVIRIKQQGA